MAGPMDRSAGLRHQSGAELCHFGAKKKPIVTGPLRPGVPRHMARAKPSHLRPNTEPDGRGARELAEVRALLGACGIGDSGGCGA